MRVGVDETRHDRLPFEIHLRGPRGGECSYLLVAANGQETAVCDCDRLRAWVPIIDRDDTSIVENQLRSGPLQKKRGRDSKGAELAEKFAS